MKQSFVFLFGVLLNVLACETTDQYDAEYMGGTSSVEKGSGGIVNATGGVPSKTTATSVSKGGAVTSTKVSTGGSSPIKTNSTGGFSFVNTTNVIISTGGFASTPIASTGGSQSIVSTPNGCVPGSTVNCTTSTGQSGYRYCLTTRVWDACIPYETTPTLCTDCDNDGVSASHDCNDRDARISPNHTEICNNGIDDNCNGAQDCTDSACASNASCRTDSDGDGESASTDCNDFDASMSHAHPEICNLEGIDEDCDAKADCSDPDCEASSYCP